MRPDRIVVGEVRDAAALDMLQAMNTGHDGSICTVHANSPATRSSRVETMVLMAGMDLPVRAIREQVSSAIDLIVHQTRFKDGTRRITHITEVVGMEGDIITLQDIFLFDHGAGFDENGRSLGHPEVDRPAPEVPRQAGRSTASQVDPTVFAFEKFGGDERGGCPAAVARPPSPSRRCSLASRAAAAPTGRIDQVDVPTADDQRAVQSSSRRTTCPVRPSTRVDVVTVDGRRSRATAVPIGARTRLDAHRHARHRHQREHGRTAVSAAAEQAARDVPRRGSRDVEVGLVTFDDGAEVVQSPTTDRAAVRQGDRRPAIANARRHGALRRRGAGRRDGRRHGPRSIVLLTDGAGRQQHARRQSATQPAERRPASTWTRSYIGPRREPRRRPQAWSPTRARAGRRPRPPRPN